MDRVRDPIRKITLTGLLLALVIIFTRFLSIQNIPVIPFVRISIGPALIIFSSIYLGPIYGAIIGAGSDILGIVMVPNALGYSINPLFTLAYGLLGVLPWVIYKLVKLVKKPQISYICSISALFLLLVGLSIFLFTTDSFTLFGSTYSFELWQKFLIVGLSLVLSVASMVAVYFTNRMFNRKFSDLEISPYSVAFASLVSEFLILLILNSIFKMIFFEVSFLVVFFAQAIVFFIDIPLNTLIITYLLLLLKKIAK